MTTPTAPPSCRTQLVVGLGLANTTRSRARSFRSTLARYSPPSTASSPLAPTLAPSQPHGGASLAEMGRSEERRATDESEEDTPSLVEEGGSSTDSEASVESDDLRKGTSYFDRSDEVKDSFSSLVIPGFRTPMEGLWDAVRLIPPAVESRAATVTETRRRGKSFTSVLVVPPTRTSTPSSSLKEPIMEVATPTTPDRSDLPYDFPPSITTTSSTPVVVEKGAPPKSLAHFTPQILYLIALFVSSLILIALLVSTLPGLFIPHSFDEIPALSLALNEYRSSSILAQTHLFFILSMLYCWKQTFSIPGSLLMNLTFGAVYGTMRGTFFTCLFTGVGALGAYGIARLLSPLVEFYFASSLNATKKALGLLPSEPVSTSSPSASPPAVSTTDLFSHLLLARFFPLLPYSVLNLISGVLQLPIPIFFTTLVVGSAPFNFVTASLGSVLATTTSYDSSSHSIWSTGIIVQLILVTAASLLPLIFKNTLKEFIGGFLLPSATRNFFKIRNWLVVRLGMVGSTNSPEPASMGSSAQALCRSPRSEARRKWNRSWGGDGFRWEPSVGQGQSGDLSTEAMGLGLVNAEEGEKSKTGKWSWEASKPLLG